MDSQPDIRISATARPSLEQQHDLLVMAHDGASDWPRVSPAQQRYRDVKRILAPLPQAATCHLTAWSGSRPIGLLLAETGHAGEIDANRLWRDLLPWPVRLSRPLRRLLRSPAYSRPDGHDGYILALAVEPCWRRQRIALRLLQALHRQHPAIRWAAHVDHAGSHALFRNAGFSELARTEAEGLVIRTMGGPHQEIEGRVAIKKPEGPN